MAEREPANKPGQIKKLSLRQRCLEYLSCVAQVALAWLAIFLIPICFGLIAGAADGVAMFAVTAREELVLSILLRISLPTILLSFSLMVLIRRLLDSPQRSLGAAWKQKIWGLLPNLSGVCFMVFMFVGGISHSLAFRFAAPTYPVMVNVLSVSSVVLFWLGFLWLLLSGTFEP